MSFLEKIDILLKENGLNKHTLAEKSNIPYTTIIGWYKKGYEMAKLSNIRTLACFFNVSLDYLIRDEVEDKYYGMYVRSSSLEYTESEDELVRAYRAHPEMHIAVRTLLGIGLEANDTLPKEISTDEGFEKSVG